MSQPLATSDWRHPLREKLTELESAHLLRTLRPVDRCAAHVRRDGRSLLNLAGNDYLGLSSHPHLIAAVQRAAEQFGVGAGASRLVTGHLEIHAAAEERFARFKHAEAALILPSGFTANLAVLTTLAGKGDLILLDKLNHASLIDAARYSGATVRVFPHRNYEKLERLLAKPPATADLRQAANRFIVTDSVFSMDGDCADLPRLVELRDRFDAVLIVDEAHATGVLGEHGSGLAEHQGVAGRIDVTISTASKALGGLGGIVTASREVIDTLVNSARSFIYTTAVPPTQVATIGAALDVIRDEPDRRRRLADISARVRNELRQSGWNIPPLPGAGADPCTPIIPLIVGESQRALALSQQLERQGLLIAAIRPPTVAPGSARLRLTLRSDFTDAEIQWIVKALSAALDYCP